MDITSEGLGEMFVDDFADTLAEKFALMLMEDERMVKRAQTVSEDPHRREQKFLSERQKSNFQPLLMTFSRLDIYIII